MHFFDYLVGEFMKLNGIVNDFVWGTPMLALLMGTGVFLTLATKFISIRLKFEFSNIQII